MITDQQVRKLRRLDGQGIAREVAAARIGMDAKTLAHPLWRASALA